MNFLKKIRYKIGNFYFKQELAHLKRKKVTTTLSKAKIIGLLFTVGNEKQYQIICDFVKSLQDERKEVKAIGYIDSKTVPYFCYPKLAYDYFTNKDLNWFLKPSNKFVSDFISKEYDILIDLSVDSCFPIQYMGGVSKAKFKVGRYGVNPMNFYDLMLQVDNKIKLDDYIKHIVHYLSILNTQNHAGKN